MQSGDRTYLNRKAWSHTARKFYDPGTPVLIEVRNGQGFRVITDDCQAIVVKADWLGERLPHDAGNESDLPERLRPM